MPEISVGNNSGKHWKENDFDANYGNRIKSDHNYPEIFPQSKSKTQDAWCYPEAALLEFRRWFREKYVGEGKFSKYINGKIKAKELPPTFHLRATHHQSLQPGRGRV